MLKSRTFEHRIQTAEAFLARAANGDPKIGMRAVVNLRHVIEQLLEDHVRHARSLEWAWQDVADVLGVSRQAAQQKYGGRKRTPRATTAYAKRLGRA